MLVIVVVVIAAVVGVGYTLYTGPSSQIATGTTGTTPATSKVVDTLSIDDYIWPLDDLNQLYAVSLLPWPDWLSTTVYQPLVTVNVTAEYQQGTIQYLPGLADSWSMSSDGKTYTFNLKQNVKFSNGDPFNAYQVWGEMYGFYYLSGNSTSWFESYNLFDMSPVNFGPATIDLMTKSGLLNPSQDLLNVMTNNAWPIYVTDPYTIVFHLAAPFVWFPGTLIAFEGFMFDTQYVLANGGFGTPVSFNSYFNMHPIPGTGPYVVSGMSENAYVKFDQNPSYWGANMTADEIAKQPLNDPGHAKHVILYNKPDDVARYSDLSANTVQIAAIQAPDWNLVTSNPQTYSYVKLPPWAMSVAWWGLNTHLYPTNIREVRQAIVHAINYTDLYQKGWLGAMSPWMGPEYPAWKDYYDLGNFPPYQYNLTLAKQYLAQAEQEYPNITSVPFLVRVPSGATAFINAAQVLQSDLAELGFTLNIQVVSSSLEWSVYGNYQTNVANAAEIGQISVWGANWAPATLTPLENWVDFVSNASLWGNSAAYSNPVVEKAISSFTSSTDTAYIQSQVKLAQAQIYNDAPYIWVGTYGLWEPAGGSLVWKPSIVTGFMTDPLWNGQSTAPLFNTVTFAS
jgi:peptide/nickel transport system substrate-binding protein